MVFTYVTVANVHMNNECAKRRSVCIALLLLIRDLCLKLGAVVLTGDFSKAVEGETPSGDFGERRISQLEAACSDVNIPWPTSGVSPQSQSQWIIMRHGSINVVPSDVGLRATDKNLALRTVAPPQVCGGRKGRRDVSPADSNSRQKIVLHTNKLATGAARVPLRELRFATCVGLFKLCRLHRTVFFFDDFSLGPALPTTMHPAACASQVASYGFRQGVLHG